MSPYHLRLAISQSARKCARTIITTKTGKVVLVTTPERLQEHVAILQAYNDSRDTLAMYTAPL